MAVADVFEALLFRISHSMYYVLEKSRGGAHEMKIILLLTVCSMSRSILGILRKDFWRRKRGKHKKCTQFRKPFT